MSKTRDFHPGDRVRIAGIALQFGEPLETYPYQEVVGATGTVTRTERSIASPYPHTVQLDQPITFAASIYEEWMCASSELAFEQSE